MMKNMQSKPNFAPAEGPLHPPSIAELLAYNPLSFFYECDVTSNILYLRRKDVIFSQGTKADSIFYIQKGLVKLTAVSPRGKEAAIAMLGPGELLGEESIAGRQPARVTTAMAFAECTLLRIDRVVVEEAMRRKPRFTDFFVSSILFRNVRLQETLADQLCLSSEKRLARVLLTLARLQRSDDADPVVPKIGQETLAEMVGTTRSRINFFMNRFREKGFIEYDRELRVRQSLANVLTEE